MTSEQESLDRATISWNVPGRACQLRRFLSCRIPFTSRPFVRLIATQAMGEWIFHTRLWCPGSHHRYCEEKWTADSGALKGRQADRWAGLPCNGAGTAWAWSIFCQWWKPCTVTGPYGPGRSCPSDLRAGPVRYSTARELWQPLETPTKAVQLGCASLMTVKDVMGQANTNDTSGGSRQLL